MRLRLASAALSAVALVFILGMGNSRQDTYIVDEDPYQEALEDADPVSIEGATLTPQADFDIIARILHSHRYRFDDESDFIPVDVALGWGVMSDTSVTNQLDIDQSGRWYYLSGPQNLPWEDIFVHSSNMHLIPSSRPVRKRVLSLRGGQTVHIWGRLVNVQLPDGGKINTSLVRTDRGGGACEIIYVDSLEVLPHVPLKAP